MMGALHSDFNDLRYDHNYNIDDVIKRLEAAARTCLENIKGSAEKAKTALASGEAVRFSGEPSFKDFINANNALVLTRGLKEAGLKTITLDPESPMIPQVIKLKKKARLTQGNWLRLSFDL